MWPTSDQFQCKPKSGVMVKHIKQFAVSLLLIGAMTVNAVDSYAQSPVEQEPAQNRIFLPVVINTGNAAEQTSGVIPGQYIVVFKEDLVSAANVSSIAADMVTQSGGEILQVYDAALQGFAARFPIEASTEAVARLQQDERIAYIEQDAIASINQETNPYQKLPLEAEEAKTTEADVSIESVQTNPIWGLDRNDQRYLPLNGKYIYFKTGAGVRAYIIDTGIRIAHSEFGGRASYGYDAVDGSLPADDCNGHGTHVAGTVGGTTYGVAKGVRLIAVRALGCNGSGSYSGIIAAVNWVTNQKRLSPTIPAVANMSLGGPVSTALDNAVVNSIKAGVTYVVAAGNNGANACNYSPAHTAGTITVGATNAADTRPTWSNYGGCVDIFAPGAQIKSAWYSSNAATAILDGTSMATPSVTGVVALYLQGSPNATPSTVRSTIFAVATTGIVVNPGTGSYNRFLYNPY